MRLIFDNLELKKAICDRAKADNKLLDELREEVRSFSCNVVLFSLDLQLLFHSSLVMVAIIN